MDAQVVKGLGNCKPGTRIQDGDYPLTVIHPRTWEEGGRGLGLLWISGLVSTQCPLLALQVFLQRGTQRRDAGGIPGTYMSPEGPRHCPA